MPVQKEKASAQDYQILNLPPHASPAQAKKAYREMVRRWHPDFFQQRSLQEQLRAEEKLKEITGAYRRISQGLNESRDSKTQPPPSSRAQAPKPPRPGKTSASKPTSSKTRASWRSIYQTVRGRVFSFTPPMRVFYGLLAVLFLSLLAVINTVPSRQQHVAPPDRLDSGANIGPLINSQAPPSPEAIDSTASAPQKQPSAETTTEPPEDAVKIRQKSSPELSISSPLPWWEGLGEVTNQDLLPFPLTPSHQGRSSQSLSPEATDSSPAPDSNTAQFSLGATQAEVLSVQGPPGKIRGQTWIYNLSDIHFKDGRVHRYNNFDGSLKVRLLPSRPFPETHAFFTLGSTQDEVLAVQGTPTRINNQTWTYGFSEIRFRDGRVVAFDNFFGNLKIRMLPSMPGEPDSGEGYFTIGSNPDEVLAVQGTPSSVQGNMWFYHFSNILFRHGKVEYVFDTPGILRFLPPDG